MEFIGGGGDAFVYVIDGLVYRVENTKSTGYGDFTELYKEFMYGNHGFEGIARLYDVYGDNDRIIFVMEKLDKIGFGGMSELEEYLLEEELVEKPDIVDALKSIDKRDLPTVFEYLTTVVAFMNKFDIDVVDVHQDNVMRRKSTGKLAMIDYFW
jgi:hypothetical protein